MTTPKTDRQNPFFIYARHATAVGCIWALLVSVLTVGAVSAQEQRKHSLPTSQPLSEDQRILHALNRLGFGARPGDVARVKEIGLERYIEQQLHPEKIADNRVEGRLADLPTLSMTTAQLFAKYPNPGMLIRGLQRRGELPQELAAIVEKRTKGDAAATAIAPSAPSAPSADAMPKASGEETMSAPGEGSAKATEEVKAGANGEYRRALLGYYMQNNLQLPQRITTELNASRILRAVYSERQLQEVMVDFWTNHFNVFAGKGSERWLLVSYDRDTIRPHAIGRFRDLLRATAESPAMLFYLDNFQSVSPNSRGGGRRREPNQQRRREMRRRVNPQMSGDSTGAMGMPSAQSRPPQQRPRRGINENYARELMELHTLGVDGGYTQRDVQEIARAFTGWTIYDPRGYSNFLAKEMPQAQGLAQKAGEFLFNPRLHDDGEKIVLGHKIPAGGGVNDGLMVLDILAKHPSTAKFIATKLCRRFVMDAPTPALVERVAAAFVKSDGDLRETLRAVFASPEFNSPSTYQAKIKTPFELAVSAVRVLNGETNGGPAFQQWVAKMGEPLYGYQAPTGYPDTAEAWVNTGALLQRMNFALALASNRIQGTRVNLVVAADAEASGGKLEQSHVVDRFANLILHGNVSPNTKAALLKQLREPASVPNVQPQTSAAINDPTARRARRGRQTKDGTINEEVPKIAGLVLGSPEFQRQ